MAVTRTRGRATWTLHVPGASLVHTLKVTRWSIRRTDSDLLHWSCTLHAKDGIYLPAGSIGQHLDGPLGPIPFAGEQDDFALLKWVQCELYLDGVLEPLPRMVIRNYSASESKGRAVEISGYCRADVLNASDQFMTQLRSRNTGPQYGAHSILTGTCAHYGIASTSFGFVDRTVPLLTRIGQPITWVKEVLSSCLGWFHWDYEDPEILRFEPGGIDIDATDSVADFTDRQDCFAFDYTSTSLGIYNQVTVQRVSELESGIQEVTGKGLGFQAVTLDRPLNYAVARVIVFGPGDANLFTWFDAADTPLSIAGPSAAISSATPIGKLQFNLEPPLGSGPSPEDIPYKCQIWGSSNADSEDWDDDFSATYADAVDQATLRGVVKGSEPMVVPSVPNSGIAMDLGQRWVRDQLAGTKAVRLRVKPRAGLGPGRVLRLHCLRYGFANHKLRIRSNELTSDGNGVKQTLELHRGPIYS